MTEHFDEKHSESQPTTCCTGCLLVITNTDGALRKHIVKHHHNQNICETCGKVRKVLFFLLKIVIFYTEILTRKVVLWCFFMSETSEKIHNSTFQVKSQFRT